MFKIIKCFDELRCGNDNFFFQVSAKSFQFFTIFIRTVKNVWLFLRISIGVWIGPFVTAPPSPMFYVVHAALCPCFALFYCDGFIV